MPSPEPRRRRRTVAGGAQRRGEHRVLHVHARGNVFVDSSLTQNTVHEAGPAEEGPRFADDLMPATLTALPVLLVIVLLSMTGQTVLLRSIVQEGNPLGLVLLLLPLFLPTIAAATVYLARARGWIRCSRSTANIAAGALATGLALFVPVNYVLLQILVFAASLGWTAIRRRFAGGRRRLAAATLLAVAVLIAVEVALAHVWPRTDLSRITVGRMLDGLTRMNIDDYPRDRSVLVISVNDAYAIVASRSYPPDVDAVPLSTFDNADICQLKPRWDQLSAVRLIGREVSGEAPPDPDAIADCIDD